MVRGKFSPCELSGNLLSPLSCGEETWNDSGGRNSLVQSSNAIDVFHVRIVFPELESFLFRFLVPPSLHTVRSRPPLVCLPARPPARLSMYLSWQVCSVLTSVCRKESLTLPPALAARVAKASKRNLRRAVLMLEACRVQQ